MTSIQSYLTVSDVALKTCSIDPICFLVSWHQTHVNQALVLLD